ncbi:FAD-dependent oxidoreductase [Candidatus Uhrbacteria bacterium]|nr:FAD-dependent oxidoreductase [Candidatus Uhrbacteria bacterium]
MNQLEKGKIWDVIVVGGGAAGFTAGLYAARRALATLVIAKDVGGQALLTQHIENYPGFIDRISGSDLLAKFWQQAEKHGAKTELDEVTKIEKFGDGFVVRTKQEREHEAKSVILAFGMTPKDMGVPGEQEFSGKGVHYCATCDAPLYKGKVTAVVGGTNAAMDAALFLAKICPKVYLVHNRANLVGDTNLVQQVQSSSVIQFLSERTVKEVRGEKCVTTLVVQGSSSTPHQPSTSSGGTGQARSGNTIEELSVDGVFVEMGYVIKTDCVKGLVELDKTNAVMVNARMATSCAGVFACGDLTDADYKQVVISAGQGAIAGLEAYKYLQLKAGKKAFVTNDWTT